MRDRKSDVDMHYSFNAELKNPVFCNETGVNQSISQSSLNKEICGIYTTVIVIIKSRLIYSFESQLTTQKSVLLIKSQ